jgi:hypothetical protein
MDHPADIRPQSLPQPASFEAGVTRSLLILMLAALFGGLAVWLLRREWAKDELWPWGLLLIVMFAAASALRQLDLWLPGQAILPQLAAATDPRRRALGAVCMALAQLLMAWIVAKLFIDYRTMWPGTPLPWLLSMLLMLAGAWLLGAVGRASPRAATASTWWSDSANSRRLEIAAFVLILLLAVLLRTWRFDSIPPGIYVDETNAGLDALYILEGRDVSPFGTGWYGTANSYIYYMAGMFKLFGANWLSLKLVSLIPALLTVPAIYFLGRLMFGPAVGLGAMFLLAVSRWHLSMSRWGWNETAPPLFQILATFFLIRGLRDRRAFDYALGGLLMGLSIYTYLSARLAAATLLLYILFWVFSDPSGVRAALRRSWLGFAIFAIAALVAVAPIAVTYASEPFTMNNRVAEISIFRDVREQNSLQPLLQNIGDMLKFFHQTGDLQGKHNLPGEPMADPVTGLFFAIGLACALLRWRDQRYFLLVAWLVLGLAGSFLSSQHESPQSYRSLTALPAVILLAADALERGLRAVYRTLEDNAGGEARSNRAAAITGGIALLLLAGAALWESTIYFGRQAASLDVVRGFNPSENRVADEVIASLQSERDIYLSPRFSEYSQLRFLVYGVVKEQTGENTLDNKPYRTLLPETDLPLQDTGRDVLILLDSTYWDLRQYILSFYPEAKIEQSTLADGSPVYLRIAIPHEQIAALQGLTRTVTGADGSSEESPVSQVELTAGNLKADEITWEGAIRIDHGGDYLIQGDGGLEVFLDTLPVNERHYLGRGVYNLRVVWKAGDSPAAQLLWQRPGQELTPVPPEVLFRLAPREQGLLGTYWNNINWENTPVFQQVTPFLMLAWSDEQPIVPHGEFSARYTGWLHIPEAGIYTLRVEADDGARLYLDEQVVGEGMIPGQPNNFDVTLALPEGEIPIRLEYFQQGGGTALRFLWSLGDGPFSPVPPSALIPATP